MDLSSSSDDGKQRGRGSYRCSKCGEPKKGHVCPYQSTYRPSLNVQKIERAVQVEMDPSMTVRELVLHEQGLPSSYGMLHSDGDDSSQLNSHSDHHYGYQYRTEEGNLPMSVYCDPHEAPQDYQEEEGGEGDIEGKEQIPEEEEEEEEEGRRRMNFLNDQEPPKKRITRRG